MGVKFLKILVSFILLCLEKVTARRYNGYSRAVDYDYNIYPLAMYWNQPFSNFIHRKPASVPAKNNVGCTWPGLSVSSFSDYQICGKFYTCNNNMKFESSCGDGQSFKEYQNGKGECVNIACSERQPWPPAPKELECDKEWKIRHDPEDENCRKYYSCHWTGDYYTYKIRSCSSRSMFNEKALTCDNKFPHCRQKYIPLPEGWNCDKPHKNSYYVHPTICSKYYNCVRDTKGTRAKLFYELDCGTGKIFNKDYVPRIEESFCIPGVCQNPLPPGWKCDGEGMLHVYPTDCKLYYKCITCNNRNITGTEKCYENVQSCPDGQYFDDTKKECVTAKTCPQDNVELPPDWHCEREGEINVHPKDCTSYYSCIKCNKPSGWCFELTKCPSSGPYFDNTHKKCVDSQICPQEWVELPMGWGCEMENDRNVVPDACTDYYTCIPCDRPRMWCYTRQQCPEGHTFQDDIMQCVRGRCPQWPPPIPENWKCTKDNELNVDPIDCTKYYKCVPCPDSDQSPWCYIPLECNKGLWFDDRLKKCTNHMKCPQEDKELPDGDGWVCENPGDVHVVPTDCRKFYQCYRCSQPKGYCYQETMCPVGSTFDEIAGECVLGKCPQDKLELPNGAGWHCGIPGETNVLPGNCSRYYMCEPCSKPAGWCYTSYDCPDSQTFDDAEKECVTGQCPQDPVKIPGNFNCSADGEVHVHPQDCSRSYQCILTGLGYFTWMEFQCPPGENFDEAIKSCVFGYCPQDLKEIGEGDEWHCGSEGEVNVFPGDCTKYFVCLKCNRPRQWCFLLPESCPKGQSFDQVQKVCVDGICPQDRPEIVDGWTCAAEGEEQVHPSDCKKYITCHKCNKPKGWCYEENTCPSGHTYDNSRGLCVPGRCAQLDPILPPAWNKCKEDGEKNVVPNDCSSFYTCISCADGPWCYKGVERCPAGETFDNTLKACVQGRCRQFPNILPPMWSCGMEGELNVQPSNCSNYYKCIMCPDMSAWCYTDHSCGPGETFDNINKKCVAGRCPQSPLPLPQGWTCTADGELNVHPSDCKKYYQCISECPDADYCHKVKTCPDGNSFDNKKKQCVYGGCPQDRPELPKGTGWNCGAEEDAHVIPSDCSSFYICYRCSKPSGWCYDRQQCPSGYTFDETDKSCVEGRCPQWPAYKPQFWICREPGDLNVNPDNCREYYKCVHCPDGGWCIDYYICPKGSNFHYIDKKCVAGSCPHKPTGIKPPPPPPIVQPNPKECRSLSHVGNRWPDYKKCNCYYTCVLFLSFLVIKNKCCWFGKSYDKTLKKCYWGSCSNSQSRSFSKIDYYKPRSWWEMN